MRRHPNGFWATCSRVWGTALLAAAVSGCGSDAGGNGPASGDGCTDPSCVPAAGGAPFAPTQPADGIPIGAGGAGTAAPTPTTTVPAEPAPVGDLPCEVAPIVADSCQSCHGATPLFGAPMSLVTVADFAAVSTTVAGAGRTIRELAIERINSDQQPMPPPPNARLGQVELDALNAWLGAGATPGTGVCDTTGTGTGDGTMEMTGVVAPPSRVNDTPCTPYEFRANGRQGPGDTSPYAVGVANDQYVRFTFDAPWQGTVHAVSFKTIVDNAEVLHHWLLYKNNGSEELQAGWAPGGEDQIMPEGVGFEMPQVSYMLEMHYNSTDPNATDRSGVEVCVADQLQPNTAALSWLGTDLIFGTSATGTCVPANPAQPIHIIGVTPHMHVKGNHMRAVINRAAGGEEVLHDLAFDFNYQVSYNKEGMMLMPGDTITTTCTYSGFSVFGPGTNDEMCYLFTLHYPAGALDDGGGSIHGDNTCGVGI